MGVVTQLPALERRFNRLQATVELLSPEPVCLVRSDAQCNIHTAKPRVLCAGSVSLVNTPP